MLKGLIGKKIGMTQIFNENGEVIPVTLIEAGPCYVTQVLTPATDGYSAVQLGFGEVHPSKLTGGQLGHLKRTNLPPLRHVRELRTKNPGVSEGDRLTVEQFVIGDRVDITGTSKGKGFAGAMKRHNFQGAGMTHGQSDRQRSTGSVAAGTSPGKVWKGKRMPGRMGNERVTVSSVRIVLVDPERNLIGVKGAVPGAKGGLLLVREGRKQ